MMSTFVAVALGLVGAAVEVEVSVTLGAERDLIALEGLRDATGAGLVVRIVVRIAGACRRGGRGGSLRRFPRRRVGLLGLV